jgi:hypothetical protein
MRKGVLILLCLSFLLSVKSESGAASISIGASTWYSDWYFKQQNAKQKPVDAAFTYGPLLSLSFAERWSWSSILLYGKFTLHDPNQKMILSRTDIDSTLNYSINGWFKLFAGAKWMQYDESWFKHRGGGPAAGFGLTLPLSKNFFVLGNASGVFMLGKQTNDYSADRNVSFREPGCNTTLAIAYAAESMPVSVSLGGRLQYFRTVYDSSSDEEDCTHVFYGVTLSAVYTFK